MNRAWTPVLSLLGLGLVLFALLGLGAPSAHAHGGNFRVDKPGNPGSPSVPGAAGKPSGPVTPGSPSPPGRANRPPRAPSGSGRAWWSADPWRTWWLLNGLAWVPPYGHELQGAAETQPRVGLFDLGRPGPGALRADEVVRLGLRRDVVLPLLLRVLEGGRAAPPNLRSTALVALGRLSIDHTITVPILRRYALAKNVALEEREGAIIGMGLLRRTDRTAQADLKTLEALRQFLLERFDDEREPVRVRAFAMYALGMLGDQRFGHSALERDGRRLVHQIWKRIEARYPSAELRIAAITALGMLPEKGVPTVVRGRLRGMVRGTFPRVRKYDGFERAHALSTLARVERGSCISILLDVLGDRRQHVAVRTASAIAIGRRAEVFSLAARGMAMVRLRKVLRTEPHATARGLFLIAFGRLLRADLKAGLDRFVDGPRSHGAYLVRQAGSGSTSARPFATMAVGLCCRDWLPRTRVQATFRRTVHGTLGRLLQERRGTDMAAASVALAVGLSGAYGEGERLLKIAKERGAAGVLRRHALEAMGLLGRRRPEDVLTVRLLLAERRSGHVFLGAVRALSLMGAKGTAATLIKQLENTRSVGGQAAIAGGLGRLRQVEATPTLLSWVQDEERSSYIRAYALVAVGLICDPEPMPSRRRFTVDSVYPARTQSMQALFNIM